MIKFYEQVPSVYPSASRDFQYLGWLIDIVLNSVKHNVDDLYNLPNNKADPRLTELLAMTLGFKVKRNYDQKQLAALVAVLPRILKCKGTKTAIDIVGNALVAASGATGHFEIDRFKTSNKELVVNLPSKLIDVSLFTDLLPYILPAGMSCRVMRTQHAEENYTTELHHQDLMLADWVPDIAWDNKNLVSVGTAGMFNTGSDITSLVNYQDKIGKDDKRNLLERFNAGLLENSMIPTIAQPLNVETPDEAEEADKQNSENTEN